MSLLLFLLTRLEIPLMIPPTRFLPVAPVLPEVESAMSLRVSVFPALFVLVLVVLVVEEAPISAAEADTVLSVEVALDAVSVVEPVSVVVVLEDAVVSVLEVLVLEPAWETKTQFPNPLKDLNDTKHDWPSAPPVQVVTEGRESARVSVPRVRGA